ncbi:MAG: nuclear transport factor 2 family protein, partial [Caulobacter sp.]|nr:nuclear transport factor 2 family protein [Caulobacter sp.]
MLSDAEIETFRLVADKLALQDLVMRYSRAVDRGDFVMLRDCYHPDATADHGDLYKGPVEQYI